MSGAIERGLAFLEERQDAAGYWSDWDLPVGPSRVWTTAYCGWRLTRCAPAPTAVLNRAADWLEANQFESGGWGYTESTGPDADSTALGILFLQAIGRCPPTAAVHRLLSFHRDDGGFATFGLDQAFGAWTASHVEVTATAALALRAIDAEPGVVERAAGFVRSRRRRDRLWDSYWWKSPWYATEVAVRLLRAPAPSEAPAQNCFEAALRLLVTGEGAGDLRSSQNSDGSWPSAPILRLTNRDLYLPETVDDAGPCFADINQVFTTATVVSALTSASP